MPRTWTWACCGVAVLAVIIEAGRALAVDPSETLFPDTTKGFISITNMDHLSQQWDKTQLGQLAKDPAIKPLADDLRKQLADRLWDLRRRLGVSLDDLSGVPGGEAAVAVALPAANQAAAVLLIDVTGRQEQAQALLAKVAKNMAAEKAKRSQTSIEGTPATVYVLPKADGAAEDEPAPQTIWVLKGDLVVACDHLGVMKQVLQHAAGSREKTLADLPAFKTTMDRCRKDAGQRTPQVRWFLDPFGYDKVVQAATPKKDRPRGKTLAQQLEAAGFGGIRGIGGFVDLAVDGFQAVHRTAVYAPKPYQGSMKMMVFPNTAPAKPPAWVPRQIATYTVIACDLLNAFDNFGPLFDQVAGEGEEGVWPDTLESLREDPDGPRIDLRAELFDHFDTEIIALSDSKLPITPTSERVLYAIKVKDAAAVAKALEKTQKVNKQARRREFSGHVIWESVPQEKAKVQKVELEAPPLGFEPEKRAAGRREEPFFPHMALSVAHGYLLIASHYDFLVRMLEPVEERETLARSIDFLIVDAALKRVAPGEASLRGFARTDEEYRPTYELLRQGKMPESESMFSRAINNFLAPEKKGAVRKQEIDASKAPEFDFVRRYLGPAGTVATSEETGWFFKGVMLSRETR